MGTDLGLSTDPLPSFVGYLQSLSSREDLGEQALLRHRLDYREVFPSTRLLDIGVKQVFGPLLCFLASSTGQGL